MQYKGKIFHLLTPERWEKALIEGRYRPDSLKTEGFIHCSTEKQVLHVANAFYRGRTDLVLLKLDEAKIKPELKWEAPAGPPAAGISESDLFPHIFGAINLNAVASVSDFTPDSVSGTFSYPKNDP